MTKLITIFDKDLNQRVFRLFYENEIVHKIDTSITISSSKSSIDVGENVILSGVLSDAGGNVLSGKNVRILKNNVLVDTVTTDSSGAYSKTISGLSAGTYHFHASFAGDDTYDNALSSTIDVNVLSHVYVVTLLSDKQSILSSESVSLSGTVTRDSEGYAGQSVRLFDGVTLVDTLTTDSNGDFSKTLSNLSVGTHRFFAQFDAYESSIVVVEVQDHDYAINISADNPIIQTGDTAIITATLTDSSNPVVGETLSYSLTNKGTVVGSGSTTTNSNGEISITYVGAGLGDIDVEVSYGSILQEVFVISDCDYANDGTKNDLINTSGASVTIENGTIKITKSTNGEAQPKYPFELHSTDDFSYEIELAYLELSHTNPMTMIINNDGSNGTWIAYDEIANEVVGQINANTLFRVLFPIQNGDKLKLTHINGVTTIYMNNTQITSASASYPSSFYVGHYTNQSRIQYVKNVKIKLL